MERHIEVLPTGLTHGARGFVQAHGVRLEPLALEEYRERWLAAGVPGKQIDRAVAFEETWGGLVLPPSPRYDGGPKYLDADIPGHVDGVGWCFEVGTPRSALPYSFEIGPDGAFGIRGPGTWVRLHASIEGWIEALSLAHHAASHASTIRVLHGAEAENVDLGGFQEVRAVQGIADQWWRGPDSLVAVYHGESEVFAHPTPAAVHIYSGLDKWGLGTDRWAVPTGWHVEGSTKPVVGWDVNGILSERRARGIHETWFDHPDGRRLGFIANGTRATLLLTTGEDDTANHDAVEFDVALVSLRRIIDSETWPDDVQHVNL